MKLHRVGWLGAVIVALLSATVAYAQPDRARPTGPWCRETAVAERFIPTRP